MESLPPDTRATNFMVDVDLCLIALALLRCVALAEKDILIFG